MSETLRTIEGRSVLRVERRFPHPPEKVWPALTESDHLSAWFPSDVEMEHKVGGAVRFVFREGEALAAHLGGRLLDWSVWDRAAELRPGYADSFGDVPAS